MNAAQPSTLSQVQPGLPPKATRNGNGAMTPGFAAGVPLPASEYAMSPKPSALGVDVGARLRQSEKALPELDEPVVSRYNISDRHFTNYISSLPRPLAHTPQMDMVGKAQSARGPPVLR